MSGYQQQPPPPKHTTSSYSSGSSDPFNNHQLGYDGQPQTYAANPYATGGPNPGAGGAGVAPPGAGGQYAPYYDNNPEMENRYEGGGMGRETWASESGWSANGAPSYSKPTTDIVLMLQTGNTLHPTTTTRQASSLRDPPPPRLPRAVTVIEDASRTPHGPPMQTSLCQRKRSKTSSSISPTSLVSKKTRPEMYTISS